MPEKIIKVKGTSKRIGHRGKIYFEGKEKVVEEEKPKEKREPTSRVHLQGWGDSPAILANEIKIGDVRLFNQGEDTIINITKKTPKTLTFTYAGKDHEGKNYTQNVRKTTKIVIKELYDDELKKEKESNISKGEKIIHIKGSSKVKAHKRRIKITRDLDRIGNKEKVTKGIISTDYNESVKNMNDYISKLNNSNEGKEIMKSINDYTLNDYNSINNYMKGGEIPILSHGMKYKKATLDNKISNIKKFINDAPKFSGHVFRGLQYATNDPEAKKRWDSFIKNIEGSKEIKFGSFLSTTIDTNIALNFARKQYYGKNIKSCVITIKTKSGVAIKSISQVPSEKEIILDNDKIYKIIEINKDDPDKIYVQLEEK